MKILLFEWCGVLIHPSLSLQHSFFLLTPWLLQIPIGEREEGDHTDLILYMCGSGEDTNPRILEESFHYDVGKGVELFSY